MTALIAGSWCSPQHHKKHVNESRILKGQQFSVGLGLKRVFSLEDTIVDHPLLCHLLLGAIVIFCFRKNITILQWNTRAESGSLRY